MKRWLRSLSFQDLSLVSFSPAASPTDPKTPTGLRWRIQHLGVVGEHDYLASARGRAGTSNVSLFNAAKIVDEAAQFGYGAACTHVDSGGTTSSPNADIEAKKLLIGQVTPNMDSKESVGSIDEAHRKQISMNQVEGSHSRTKQVQVSTCFATTGSPLSSPAQLSDRIIYFVHAIQDLKRRQSFLTRRLDSLRTINHDDERRLNNFLDVLRHSLLSPASPGEWIHKDEEQRQAENTLTKLERLFIRSSDGLERADKELVAVKQELAAMREGLEIELLKSVDASKLDTKHGREISGVNGDDTEVHIANLMEELGGHEQDLDGSVEREEENRAQHDPKGDMPQSSQLPPSPRAATDGPERPQQPTSQPHRSLEQAKSRLHAAQAHFDELPLRYLKDAQTYHQTYRSCLKSVTDFDLEHLLLGREATRELIDAEQTLEQTKRDLQEERRKKKEQQQQRQQQLAATCGSVEAEEKEETPPSPEQTSGFISLPEDAEILRCELHDAVQGVDRVRIERWRRHVVHPEGDLSGCRADVDQPITTATAEINTSDCASTIDLPSLTCGESICGVAEGKSRTRIDRWRDTTEGLRCSASVEADIAVTRQGIVMNSTAYRCNGNFGGLRGVGAGTAASDMDGHEVCGAGGDGKANRFAVLHVDEYEDAGLELEGGEGDDDGPPQRLDLAAGVTEKVWWTSSSVDVGRGNLMIRELPEWI